MAPSAPRFRQHLRGPTTAQQAEASTSAMHKERRCRSGTDNLLSSSVLPNIAGIKNSLGAKALLAPLAPRFHQAWCRAGSWSHFVGWWPLNEYTQHNRRTAAGCVPGEHYDTMLVFEKLAPLVAEPSCLLFVSKIGIGSNLPVANELTKTCVVRF